MSLEVSRNPAVPQFCKASMAKFVWLGSVQGWRAKESNLGVGWHRRPSPACPPRIGFANPRLSNPPLPQWQTRARHPFSWWLRSKAPTSERTLGRCGLCVKRQLWPEEKVPTLCSENSTSVRNAGSTGCLLTQPCCPLKRATRRIQHGCGASAAKSGKEMAPGRVARLGHTALGRGVQGQARKRPQDSPGSTGQRPRKPDESNVECEPLLCLHKAGLKHRVELGMPGKVHSLNRMRYEDCAAPQ